MRKYAACLVTSLTVTYAMFVAETMALDREPDVSKLLKRPFCNSYGCRNGKRNQEAGQLVTEEPNGFDNLIGSDGRFEPSRKIARILRILMSLSNGNTNQLHVSNTRNNVANKVGRHPRWSPPRKTHPSLNDVIVKRPFCNHFGCANGKRDDSRAVARNLRRWLAYVRAVASQKKRNRADWDNS